MILSPEVYDGVVDMGHTISLLFYESRNEDTKFYSFVVFEGSYNFGFVLFLTVQSQRSIIKKSNRATYHS